MRGEFPSRAVRKNPRPTDEQFREAYEHHRSDTEAAVALGIHRVEFSTWRKHANLRSKSPWKSDRPTLSATEEARRRVAYEATRSDREAARSLQMNRLTFRQWRIQRGLPDKGKRVVELTPEENRRRLEAYNVSKSSAEAARRLGIGKHAFDKWRRHAHLPAYHDWRPWQAANAKRIALYRRADTDREIAAGVGVTESAVNYWRKRHALPAKTGAGSPLPPEEWERRRAVIMSAKDADEAATILRIGRARVWACVRELELDPPWPRRPWFAHRKL